MADRESDGARAAVLARIRAALGSGPAGEPPQATTVRAPPAPVAPLAERIARFAAALERVGGQAHRVRDEAAAVDRLAGIAGSHRVRELACSDDALVRRLADRLPDTVRAFEGWSDRERLFACDLGLTSAQAAIAETGTLVLESATERHRLVSLVPPLHVAVLRAETILEGLGAALHALARPDHPSRAVTLITGPSRTADIELQLVVGVHGPRELHVVILEESLA